MSKATWRILGLDFGFVALILLILVHGLEGDGKNLEDLPWQTSF